MSGYLETLSLRYGKRQSMTDASGTTNYGYDSMDRLTSKPRRKEL